MSLKDIMGQKMKPEGQKALRKVHPSTEAFISHWKVLCQPKCSRWLRSSTVGKDTALHVACYQGFVLHLQKHTGHQRGHDSKARPSKVSRIKEEAISGIRSGLAGEPDSTGPRQVPRLWPAR